MSTHTSGGALTRRQAIAAAAFIPTTAVATDFVDPHRAWFEEWRVHAREYADAPDDADFAPIVREIDRLGDFIADTPALTRDGHATKLRFLIENYLDFADGILDVRQARMVLLQVEQFLEALS